MNVIFTRRSVRDFLPKPVEKEKLERVLKAAFEAPSAANKRPWEFMVFTGKKERQAIGAMSPYAKMCSDAAAILVCCVDLKIAVPGHEKDGGPEPFWVQDLSAATENALLQITEEGLGGVWIGWYPDMGRVNEFKKAFSLPDHIWPVTVIALGYPAKTSDTKDRYDPSKVHWEAW